MANRQRGSWSGGLTNMSELRKKYVGKLVRINYFCASIHKIHKGQIGLIIDVDRNNIMPLIILVDEQKRRFGDDEISILRMDSK